MDYAGVALLIALFVSNAVGLDLLYNHRLKLAGTLNIVNLCLTVALAYNFDQMNSIMLIFLIIAIIVVIFLLVRLYLSSKKRKQKRRTQPIDADLIEDKYDV